MSIISVYKRVPDGDDSDYLNNLNCKIKASISLGFQKSELFSLPPLLFSHLLVLCPFSFLFAPSPLLLHRPRWLHKRSYHTER